MAAARGRPNRPGLLPPDVDALYDAFTHPRATRPQLPLLPPVEARAYCSEVRGRVLDKLEALPGTPTVQEESAFPYGMVVSHEQQHDETLLQALQLRDGAPLLGEGSALPSGRDGVAGRSVLVPGGRFVLGVDAGLEPFSLDNERPAHVVDVPAFRIGTLPVTNDEWAQFIAAGGYGHPRWWSVRGWQHRLDTGLERPLFWGTDSTRTRFGIVEDIPADEPVQHVTFFEAEAYATWIGARLPTEIEWEKACAWDEESDRRRRFPWATRRSLRGWLISEVRRYAQPRWAPIPPGPRRAVPSRCWATYGNGPPPRCSRGRAFARCSTGITPRRFSTGTTGYCAAVRGRWGPRFCGRVSGTGTTRSAGRSSPACDWPGTSEPTEVCRHLGWLGAPRSLASLMLEPEHGLLVQSYAPRRQRYGTINADGWGAGFFSAARQAPVRWRSPRPLWSEPSFASLAPILRSGCVVAAVRSATAGMPVDESAAAPFTDGRWLLSHNGIVDRSALPAARTVESTVDSAVLAALVFDRGLDRLARTVTEVSALDPGARLNLLAGDGDRLLATTWGDTLSVLSTTDGVVVASEP